MEKLVCCLKNKNAGCFYEPYIVEDTDEAHLIEKHRRMFIIYPDKANGYKYCQLYSLGTYDDITGVITSKVNFICDFDDILSQLGKVLNND